MKHLLLCCLLLLSAPAWAQDVAERGTLDYLNEKYGFRDATFEKPFSAFKGMTLVQTHSHEKTYTRKTDALKIGDAPIDRLRYVFLDNLLSEVKFTISGHENLYAIKSAFIVNYGEPQESKQGFFWTSTRVILDVKEIAPQLYSVSMLSKPLLYKRDEHDLEDADKTMQKHQRKAVRATSDL